MMDVILPLWRLGTVGYWSNVLMPTGPDIDTEEVVQYHPVRQGYPNRPSSIKTSTALRHSLSNLCGAEPGGTLMAQAR